jgi:hypothetical protein
MTNSGAKRLNDQCEIYVDPSRIFKDDISVMSELFSPAVSHLSVEFVLPLKCFGLHLHLQVRAYYVWNGECAYLRA